MAHKLINLSFRSHFFNFNSTKIKQLNTNRSFASTRSQIAAIKTKHAQPQSVISRFSSRNLAVKTLSDRFNEDQRKTRRTVKVVLLGATFLLLLVGQIYIILNYQDPEKRLADYRKYVQQATDNDANLASNFILELTALCASQQIVLIKAGLLDLVKYSIGHNKFWNDDALGFCYAIIHNLAMMGNPEVMDVLLKSFDVGAFVVGKTYPIAQDSIEILGCIAENEKGLKLICKKELLPHWLATQIADVDAPAYWKDGTLHVLAKMTTIEDGCKIIGKDIKYIVNTLSTIDNATIYPLSSERHFSRFALSNLAKYYKNKSKPVQLSQKEWDTLLSYENKAPSMKFYHVATADSVVWSSVSGIVWGFLKTTAQNIRKPGGFFSPEIRSAMKTNSIKAALGASTISVLYAYILYYGRELRVNAKDKNTKFYISMASSWISIAMFFGVPFLLPNSLVPLIPYGYKSFSTPIVSLPYTSI